MPNQESPSAWMFGNSSVSVGTRGSFARTWKLSSRLFSLPDWLPLGLQGCSVTQTNNLVGIRRLLLLWLEKLFCRSLGLSLLWKLMWTTATLGKFTNNSTSTMRNMFVGTCKDYFYYFDRSILGDPVSVSWVRKNGGKSFQERAREPLECYS